MCIKLYRQIYYMTIDKNLIFDSLFSPKISL